MKVIGFFFLFLMMCGLIFAKSPLPELEKVKKIKLLESTRDDVRRILADYKDEDSEDEDSNDTEAEQEEYDADHYKQSFDTENAEIVVTFSSGDCSNDFSYWNVSKWVATKVKINVRETVKIKDFKFWKFTKEIPDKETPEYFNYHDEKAGIVFTIDEDEVEKIILYPPKSKNEFLCTNENTKKISSNEKRVVDLLLEEPVCILINRHADVTDLILSASEITSNFTNSKTQISVRTIAVDPENDVLTYRYDATVGKIIGAGADVVWDLSGVYPGTYTITAGVDDSCGVCGKTVTKTVVVKACPDCIKDK